MSTWRARGAQNSSRGNTPGRGDRRGAYRGRGHGQPITGNHSPQGPVNAWSNAKPSDSSRSAPQAGKTTSRPMHTRRQMELMASVSRSSGLEKDGDSLKDHRTQDEYRAFIQEKLEVLQKRESSNPNPSASQKANLREQHENLLILFRKLREGVSSSNRRDQFALEVYETSLFLSAIFDIPRQTTAIIPQLVTDVYLSCPPPHDNSEATLLVALLHYLIASYPSQGLYNQYLDSIPLSLFPNTCPSRKWVINLAKCLRTKNYYKTEQITREDIVTKLFPRTEGGKAGTDTPPPTFARNSVRCLVDRLRAKIRESAWTVIRSAYRELSCHAESGDTRVWLTRSLCLDTISSNQSSTDLDDWLDQQSGLGHVRRKEGVEGRWIVSKVP